jgi:hypothetical protein
VPALDAEDLDAMDEAEVRDKVLELQGVIKHLRLERDAIDPPLDAKIDALHRAKLRKMQDAVEDANITIAGLEDRLNVSQNGCAPGLDATAGWY